MPEIPDDKLMLPPSQAGPSLVGESAKVEAAAVTAVVRDLERHQLLPA